MFDNVLKFTKSKGYDYFLIGLLIFAVTLLIIFYFNLQYLDQFKPIATLQFPESEWIKINKANMYTKIGSGAISPNEQVVLMLNVTNKVPLNILIEPEFHTYLAGNLIDVKNIRGTVYGFEHTSTITENYFPTLEGLNVIKVALRISYSNGTFLTYQNDTTSFDVISQTDELQIKQNDYLFWGVVASAIIGGGTITALLISVIYSRKEVALLEATSRNESRPWLGATTMMTHVIGPPRLVFHFKNYGKIPATHIKERHVFLQSQPQKKDIQDYNDEVIYSSVLSPDQSADFIINIVSQDVLDSLAKGQSPLYIGIRIDYIFDTDKKGQYGVIFEYDFNGKRFLVKEEWSE